MVVSLSIVVSRNCSKVIGCHVMLIYVLKPLDYTQNFLLMRILTIDDTFSIATTPTCLHEGNIGLVKQTWS